MARSLRSLPREPRVHRSTASVRMPPSLAGSPRNFLPRIALRSACHCLAAGSHSRLVAMQGSFPRSARRHFALCTGKNAVFPATSNMFLHNPAHRIPCSPGWKNCVATDRQRCQRAPATRSNLRRAGTAPAQTSRSRQTARTNWHTGIQIQRSRKSHESGANSPASRALAAPAPGRHRRWSVLLPPPTTWWGTVFPGVNGRLAPSPTLPPQGTKGKKQGQNSARHSLPIGASSCALAPLVERLRKRKRSLLENIGGWGLAMELALIVTTAAGSALLGCWLDSQGKSRPGPTFTLECSTGTGAYPFSRHRGQRGNLLFGAYR